MTANAGNSGFPVIGAVAPHMGVLSDGARLGSALQALQDELIASQRLATLGNLAAIAAHEFNNLMTPIIARAEAALTGPPDVAFMRKTIERSLTQAQRAVGLTRHLLELAHGDGSTGGACRLSHVVREALETTTRPLEKDSIALSVDVPDDLWVAGHEDLVVQVLLNLILNARAALKAVSGGSLVIAARASDDYITITVRDTGKGMPTDWISGTLNPFLASDPLARATDWHNIGLGLSACRLIAHRHGARLKAQANPEHGCTFTLTWPRGARPAGIVGTS